MKSLIQSLVVSSLLAFTGLAVAQNHPTSGEVRLRSTNHPDRVVRNIGGNGQLQAANSAAEIRSATFRIVPGLAGRGVSFQSTEDPNLYLRHQGFQVRFHRNDNSPLFRNDATFEPRRAVSGAANAFSYESVNFAGHYLRHCSFSMFIDNNARGNTACNADADVFRQDVSFTVEGAAPAQAAQAAFPAANKWYRFRTQFRGQGECLEANGPQSPVHNGASFMDRCQNVTGQIFRFVPAGDGLFRIQTRLHGEQRCLEGNQPSSPTQNGSAFMDTCQNVSGQLWRVVPHNGGYRLQNQFRGQGECLEGNQATSPTRGGNAFMDRCQNVSGQVWLFEEVR